MTEQQTTQSSPSKRRPVLRALSVGALLCALAILAALGTWQGSKFIDKWGTFALMDERLELEPIDISSATQLTDDVDFRPVRLQAGALVPDQTALVVRRFHKHRPGSFVYTPFRFTDGSTVLVQRGWVPEGNAAQIVAGAPLPDQDLLGFVYTPKERTADLEARERVENGQFSFDPTPEMGEGDTEVLYEAMGDDVTPPPRLNTVVVLSEQFASTWPRDGLPEPAWQHITTPYLTPSMHLGYTVMWYGSGVVLMWVFWAGWTGRLNPGYRRRED